MTDLVLASTSPYRRQLLARLRVPYRAVAHRCDERAAAAGIAEPDAIARTLARAKAESLSADHDDAFVLGSDQLVDVDGRVLGKPGNAEGAREQLRALSGRTHRLVTAVALRHPGGRIEEALDVHRMTMRDLSEDEIARYVERESPVDCAGSYKIEGLGIALFDAVEGRDFTAIVGLPLATVAAMLRAAGFRVP